MSKNLTGQRFGLLVALEIDNTEREGARKRRYWKCQCDCGKVTSVVTDCLTRDITHSCGCGEGKSHGMSYTRQYNIWQGVKSRCLGKNDTAFHHYGGRGILVCDKWLKFEGFWEDMQEGYSDDLTLERKDVNGNYEKSNCRWATVQEQHYNMRSNRIFTIDNERMCLAQVVKKYNIASATIWNRLNDGWDIKRVVDTPIRNKFRNKKAI